MKRRLGKWLEIANHASPEGGVGIARTLILSAMVGAVAGLGAVVLVSMLQLVGWFFLGGVGNYMPGVPEGEPVMFEGLRVFVGEPRRWVLLFLPMLGALVSGVLVFFLAPEAEGHGTDSAIEAYHFRGGKVRPIVPPVKAVATALLIGTGGSAGCEGPITQIGAGFGSLLATSLRLSVAQRRVLMAAGMGAGVGALFHAPMAGALFAAEVLYRDLDLEYEVLVPAVIASVTAHAVFSNAFGFHPLFETPLAAFSRPRMLLLYIVLALVLAFGARFYTWCFYIVQEKFNALRMPRMFKPALGGLLTGIVGFFFLPALGQGYGVIQEALRLDANFEPGAAMVTFWFLIGVFFLKTLTTAFSVGSGGSGGIFGPAIVVGGALGGAFGVVCSQWLPAWDVPVGAFTLVGMIAFFGCAAKTPISTILMVSEMTGNFQLLVPSMWVCMIAYMLSRKVSLYRSQLPNRFEAPIHRGRMISGVLNSVTVKHLLDANPRRSALQTVLPGTPLSELIEVIVSGEQKVFPVVSGSGKMIGIVAARDLAAVSASDPMLGQTLLVDDLDFPDHAVVTEADTLQTVLHHLDADDVDAIIVVSKNDPTKPVGMVSHADVAEAYHREMGVSR